MSTMRSVAAFGMPVAIELPSLKKLLNHIDDNIN